MLDNIPRYHSFYRAINKVNYIFSPVLPNEGINYFFSIKLLNIESSPTRCLLIHSFTQNCELLSRILFSFTEHPLFSYYDIYIALYGSNIKKCVNHLLTIYKPYITGIIPEPEQLSQREINDERYKLLFYQYAMNYVFLNKLYDVSIVLEEKTIPTGDLIDYSLQTETLLFFDTSLFCISYYNDNGYSEYVYSATQLYRSELFPTYGYMINRKNWGQINNYWPTDGGSGWDHFIRTYIKEYNLECITPEFSRIYVVKEYDENKYDYYQDKVEYYKGDNVYYNIIIRELILVIYHI